MFYMGRIRVRLNLEKHDNQLARVSNVPEIPATPFEKYSVLACYIGKWNRRIDMPIIKSKQQSLEKYCGNGSYWYFSFQTQRKEYTEKEAKSIAEVMSKPDLLL